MSFPCDIDLLCPATLLIHNIISYNAYKHYSTIVNILLFHFWDRNCC